MVTRASRPGLVVFGVMAGLVRDWTTKFRRLYQLLSDPGVRVRVIEHRSCLTRFGLRDPGAAPAGFRRCIVVPGPEGGGWW